jgi:DNA-directed RNA polymerase subunit alpha
MSESSTQPQQTEEESRAPETARKHLEEGRQSEKEGDRWPALEAFERAFEADPEDPEVCFRLAYHLDLVGEDEEAIHLYQQAVDRPNPPIQALLNLAVLHEDRGAYDKAAQCVKQVLASHPNHPRARLFQKDIDAGQQMVLDDERERELEKWHALLETPVTDFNLQVKTRNALRRIDIRTLADLLRTTEPELRNFKIDEDSIDEVKRMLAQRGLRLGQGTERHGGGEGGEGASDEVRARSVNELDLSVRARKALALLNVQTLGELCDKTEEELMAIKNFGTTSLEEIKAKLHELGLALRQMEGEASSDTGER